MNLSKRASLLILPVILVSYALAMMVIYQQEKQSLYTLEVNLLEHKLSKLKSSFNSYQNFVDSYLLSLLEGETFAKYIQDPDNIYKVKVLTANLNSVIERYFERRDEFASLSVIKQGKTLSLYIENSFDPFSTVKPMQMNLAKRLNKDSRNKEWEHLIQNGHTIIQKGLSLDSRTLQAPVFNQEDHVIQMIVAVEPREFDTLLAQYQSEYQAIITYSIEPQPEQTSNFDLKSSIHLNNNYRLVFNPNSQFMANSLLELKLRLIFIFIICSALTYLLLQVLIKRHITGPIANLDYQLTAVMEQRQEEISYPHDDNEIGRLGKKFKSLYSQLKRSLDETYTYSRTDSLTQLPNRNSFYETATKKLADAEKHNCKLAILYLDLDNFKFVNDKYGHEIGDQLLKAVAAKMNHTVQLLSEKCSTCRFQVFRLSGDEFTLLMEYVDPNSISSFGKKVLHSFDNGFSFELGHFPVTASLGIATYPEDGHTLSQLISNADLAMYQAKKAGKNQMSFYSKDLAKKDRYKKDIESRLKEVDFDKEFYLSYMPILDRNNNIKGCEALVRWNSKDLGPVSPALFIPIAETTGLFEKIDLWVISQAFKDTPKLKAILGEDMEISINISSAEINSERFIKKLSHLERRFNPNTANIVFEITETYMPEHQNNALVWLDQLRESGYKIAIDDFGTGYTSLMQMVEYPIDIIKFDKQLVERIALKGKTELAQALVDLCHLQGVKVVAEGVETLEQFNILKQINCDYQQGFYISKPMLLEELASWVKKDQLDLKITAIG